MKRSSPALLPVLALLAVSAWGDPGGDRGSCADDVDKFCADARAQGGPAVGRCLKAHRDALSADCRGQIGEDRSAEGGGGSNACLDDARRFCPDAVGGGREALKSCLRSHRADLSAECRARWEKKREALIEQEAAGAPPERADEFKAALRRVADSCKDERHRLCSEMDPKKGAVLRCLLEHRDGASPDCRGALEGVEPFAAGRAPKPGKAEAPSAGPGAGEPGR